MKHSFKMEGVRKSNKSCENIVNDSVTLSMLTVTVLVWSEDLNVCNC